MEETKQKEWEEKYARDLGMCCAGCDCGHCNKRRDVISTLLSEDRAKTVEMVEKLKQKYIKYDEKYFGGYGDEIDTCEKIIKLLNNRE